jgi:hypothetical protein
VILLVTLGPSRDAVSGVFEWCFLCGESGLSDAIANVLLFAPLAAGLYWSGLPGRRVVATGLALSLAIEFLQLRLVPGRDATLSDIVANTLGSCLGVACAWWLPVRRRSGSKTLVTAAALLALIAGAGVALRPSFPNALYYGQWTDNLGRFEQYRGRVLSAEIGGTPLPPDRLADSRTVHSRLERGAKIRIRAVAGPPTRRFAPLFSISPGLLLVGPDGDDLVLRVRTRAIDWRLEQPDLRWRGAMSGVAAGDTLLVELSRAERGYCMRLGERERCGLAYTVGQAWGILEYHPLLPVAAQTILSCVFMAILGLPVGLVFRRGWSGNAAVAVAVAGVAVLPTLAGLAPTPPVELAALLAGGVAGALAP